MIEHLRGQLEAIEEDGTEEHNTAVSLRQEIARLREALEFHTDHYNWSQPDGDVPVLADRGDRARMALTSNEGNQWKQH